MDILNYFPRDKTPRKQQADILEAIEAWWNKTDVFVITAPTGTGKSAISVTLASFIKNKYKRDSAILTPNNMLSEQYHEDYPKIPVAYGATYSKCKDVKFKSCGERRQFADLAINKQKRMTKYCKDCPHKKSQTRHNILNYPFTYITNYHKYVSLKRTSDGKAAREYLIIDEAHLLVDTVKEYNKDRIWHHQFPYSEYKDRDALLEGLKSTQLDTYGNNVFQKAIDMLEMVPPRYILKEEQVKYHSEVRPQLTFNPITSKGLDNPIITSQVRKTFLLSATINYKDIEELGLDGKRVTYIDSDSCIPIQARPIISLGTAKVKGRELEETAPILAEEIKRIADFHPDSKGLVHATYAQAKVLKHLLADNPRFLFHSNKDKQQVYQGFRDTGSNSILVASGMYEGIDLPYEAGRFQMVAKIPFPNLGEPAVMYQTEQDDKWYQWQAVKTILQAGGRICRTPTDYGVTYVLDSNFNNLYSRNQDLFPLWFREAVEIREKVSVS